MSEKNPIEIRPEDIIKRPAPGLPATGQEKGFSFDVKSIKKYIGQAREFIDLAKELGMGDQLAGLGIKIPGMSDKEPVAENPQRDNQGINQAKAFIQLLIVKYGDITVNELLEKLKDDFGNKKISQIGK